MKKVAILHYASPPTVGGVESTIYHHARGLVQMGYAVKVVTGSGTAFDDRIDVVVNPLFGSRHHDILKAKEALDQGQRPADFEILVAEILQALRASLADCEVCMAHNVLTLHKNLPLSAALAQYCTERPIKLIAWCHDLAWQNGQYQAELHAGYPWDLLRQRWESARYVTVSQTRRPELAALLNMPEEEISVVVPGVDPAHFFQWTPTTSALARQLRLLDADGLLLLPARLTRRKNISLGLRVLAEVRRQSERDFRLIITGPPGPHNPTNPGYLGELLELCRQFGLEHSAHFLYSYGDPLIPDDETIANLYQLADALFFPSLQEGFGIPVLEAGLVGLPIFCSDIAPFRETGSAEVTYFNPVHEPPDHIAGVILKTLDNNPQFRLRVRVRQRYRWDAIIRQHILPMLEEG